MKKTVAMIFLMLLAGSAAAQEKLADQLRKAIVEEEANQNLDKAIQTYSAILAQYDEMRRTAATALFHMAECYRKQGKNEQAATAYQRLVWEFPEEVKLVEASRKYVNAAFTFNLQARQVAEARKLQDLKMIETYRKLIEEEIKLVEDQIRAAQQRIEIGLISPTGPEITALKKELLELRLRLAAVQAGKSPDPVKK